MSTAGRRIAIQGTVQGVGFRPWVYRLAHQEGVAGSVRNDAEGVTIEAFGPTESIDRFVDGLVGRLPPAAAIHALAAEPLEGPVPDAFTIVPSASGPERRYAIPPDLATCPACLEEVFDPGNARFRYPFTNCTDCGPRFTITLDLPYDRPTTTMAGFEMCPSCKSEYGEPLDRRFHAQPNACAVCGPRLELLDPDGSRLARQTEALVAAALAIRQGSIVAVKGLGGFHLMVAASDGRAVARLRRRKHRWEKPLAVMARCLADAEAICEVDEREAALLTSAQAPIVLLRRRPGNDIAKQVAPGNPRLGLMLPATPLHHLLLAMSRGPVVATSGNLSDEPICIDDDQALARLHGIADLFLTHDRPIARHADDSVTILLEGAPSVLRRARGYAPSPIRLSRPIPDLIAVGAHMKNVVALSRGDQVVLSQHIGDMETPQAIAAFEGVVDDLLRMLEAEPVAIAHDLHPDYPSTLWATRASSPRPSDGETSPSLRGLPLIPVQHHHAHLASCLAENGCTDTALGVTFDGTGYGTDDTVWGGEILLGDARSFRRIARLRPFPLLGGEAAVREPRRCALATLAQVYGRGVLDREDLAPLANLSRRERRLAARLLETRLGSPLTSSAGRLFDAVASLLGLRQTTSYEGQAAMTLEFAADRGETGAYPMLLSRTEDGSTDLPPTEALPGDPGLEIDWRPTIEALVEDLRSGRTVATIAARFHNTLVASIVEIAREVGAAKVALSGGCFQNELLTARASGALAAAGFEVLLHRRVPTNDGGIALGQIAVAATRLDPTADPGERTSLRKESTSCV